VQYLEIIVFAVERDTPVTYHLQCCSERLVTCVDITEALEICILCKYLTHCLLNAVPYVLILANVYSSYTT
jgi:hypothetical protein